jgi:redox-sensitive bicupin YhaK (pirin superfamily)
MATVVQHLLRSHSKDIGGFSVMRLLPAAAKRMVGPIVFFDHMGPAKFAPGQGIDVRPHPHIGLATVTYLFEGAFIHKDSLGTVQRIEPGEVNWMTAGSGIAHSERTPPKLRAAGSTAHGIQTWVALPREAESVDPSFTHIAREQVPVIELDGTRIHLIAGNGFSVTSPTPTYSPMLYASATSAMGSTFEFTREHTERAIYVVSGSIQIGADELAPGSMAVLEPGADVVVKSNADSQLMLLGGEPLESDRFIWWNFVASDKRLIEHASKRWHDRSFPQVPGDDEFIPLPER